MEENKNVKIEKNKTYTGAEVKELFENAMKETMKNPIGKCETGKDDPEFQFHMMITSIPILHTMEDNLFEEEKSDERI